MTFSYDASQLATSTLYQVRSLIGDTKSANELVQDEEINFALSERGGIYGAAAQICRALAARFAREVDTVDRDLRTTYSQRSSAFLRMATDYEKRAASSGGAAIITIGVPDSMQPVA